MSLLQKLDSLWRSTLFTLFTAVFTVIYCVICILVRPFPVIVGYRVIRFWTMTEIWMVRVLCGIDYQVEGVENIPKDRVGVVLCKHQSTWETFFLPRYFLSATVITKRELLWVPFFGWGMASMAPIAINRRDQKSAMQQVIDQGKKCLAEGRWVIVYPEGTRTAPGKAGKYRTGGARLAVAAEAPVLPVAHNAGRYWPKRGFLKRPGVVKVAFGPLIETAGKTPEAVLEQAKNWIESTVTRLDGNP